MMEEVESEQVIFCIRNIICIDINFLYNSICLRVENVKIFVSHLFLI